jgi:hypothetical protein
MTERQKDRKTVFFLGLSSDSISEIVNDRHTKLVILDKGNGYMRHQLIRYQLNLTERNVT